ncbi:MAG: hypothetical protein IBX64_04985 [Actinobacteria bacterium]|nr:hypothetical protein [Actinomycetota bacterium]
MSIVAFSFMVGGAIGTSIGGHLISSFGYQSLFTSYGVLLIVLSAIAYIAISEVAS